MYTRPNPTQSAIETAEKNAAKMWEQGYTQKQSQSVPEIFFVTKPSTGKTYLVNTSNLTPSCDCPQWEAVGYCKHQEFVRINLMEAEYEAEQEYRAEYADALEAYHSR